MTTSHRRLRHWASGVVVLLVLAVSSAGAETTFGTDIPAGEIKSMRVRNLPADSVVSLDLKTDGAVVVTLVRQNAPSPDKLPRPVFRGKLDGKLSFTVQIQEAGNYVVIFDNRGGNEARRAEVSLNAKRGADAKEAALLARRASPATLAALLDGLAVRTPQLAPPVHR